jgi:aldose 1-epimerase
MKRRRRCGTRMQTLIHTLSSSDGLQLQVSTIGAAWISCQVPLPGGECREVLLGHPDPASYPLEVGYLGQFIGRCANRIVGARFPLPAGGEAQLLANEGANQLHGGPFGFHTRFFAVVASSNDHLHLSLHSPDGDQGFPGALDLDLHYRVLEGLRLCVSWEARCSAPCPVNLTHHAYFNLDAKHTDTRDHRLRIAGGRYLPVGIDLLPTGEIRNVDGSAFDLREGLILRTVMSDPEPQQVAVGQGYDHNWLLDEPSHAAAELSNAELKLEIRTDLPGIQLYTGQYLTKSRSRDGSLYAAYSGIALEPQYFPDSPNHPEWPQPSCWLRPGQVMRHWIEYSFTPTSSVELTTKS